MSGQQKLRKTQEDEDNSECQATSHPKWFEVAWQMYNPSITSETCMILAYLLGLGSWISLDIKKDAGNF